jgi:hypothetical protein
MCNIKYFDCLSNSITLHTIISIKIKSNKDKIELLIYSDIMINLQIITSVSRYTKR